MIEVQNLHVGLSGKTILSAINLTAEAGKFAAIVGPNGSGKTTLLRAISGEIDYQGSISIEGKSLDWMSSYAQASIRGVLSQSTSVAFPFTVREVVTLGGIGPDASSDVDEVNATVDTVLMKVGLSDFKARRYNELSGGEQQRVQLARVLFRIGAPVGTSGPRWLLLDEPVSSLDIRHQLQIMNIAKEFSEEGGGVLAVMHDLNLTAMFSDTVFMMNSGKLVENGSPQAVFSTDNVARVFDCNLVVSETPRDGVPFILPQSASASHGTP